MIWLILCWCWLVDKCLFKSNNIDAHCPLEPYSNIYVSFLDCIIAPVFGTDTFYFSIIWLGLIIHHCCLVEWRNYTFLSPLKNVSPSGHLVYYLLAWERMLLLLLLLLLLMVLMSRRTRIKKRMEMTNYNCNRWSILIITFHWLKQSQYRNIPFIKV